MPGNNRKWFDYEAQRNPPVADGLVGLVAPARIAERVVLSPRISDADIERIAKRVAELLKGDK